MTDKLNPLRRFQKRAGQAKKALAAKAGQALESGKQQLNQLDDQLKVTERVREKGVLLSDATQSLDEQMGVSDRLKQTRDKLGSSLSGLKQQATELAEQSGVNERVRAGFQTVKQNVIEPGAEWLETSGINATARQVGSAMASSYGQTRAVIKPYFAPESARELLQNTHSELARIAATIMQTSVDETDKLSRQFSNAVLAKSSGLAAAGVTLATVGALSTASTGTAIAGLSGAAANTASLYWLGNLVGGGVAAGTFITGGIGLVVGLAAYKLLSSEARPFESLTEVEQHLVQGCWLLMARIDEMLQADSITLDGPSAQAALDHALLPLYQMLTANADTICEHLDNRHSLILRQHVLVDFERVVIQSFRHWSTQKTSLLPDNTEYLIGGVFYALLTRTALNDSPESQLVLQALRRSDHELANATEADISDYLDRYSDEQLKGIANNVKGIYHELLHVQQYNATHTDTYAELFEQTNHPGADVLIRDIGSGQVVDQYQLKAVQSTASVELHQHRYADIEVLATAEVADRMPGVESSGISNDTITEQTRHGLDALADNTVPDRIAESLGLAAGVASGREFVEMLRGHRAFPDAILSVLKATGSAGAATALTAFLFS